MRRSVLLAVFCLYSFVARADRCILNPQDIVQKALGYLQGVKTVIYYCPTCVGDNRMRYVEISDLKIGQEGQEWFVQIDKELIDLAYIYLPSSQSGIYRNLGYVIGCAYLKGTPVLEYLNVKYPYGIEKIEKLSMQLMKCTTQNCIEEIYQIVLQSYLKNKSNTLQGFSTEKVFLPEEVSQQTVQGLLKDISHYYGAENLEIF